MEVNQQVSEDYHNYWKVQLAMRLENNSTMRKNYMCADKRVPLSLRTFKCKSNLLEAMKRRERKIKRKWRIRGGGEKVISKNQPAATDL